MKDLLERTGVALLCALVLWPVLALALIICGMPADFDTIKVAYIITALLVFIGYRKASD